MAVTIHLPQVHRPDMKRLATAGVAVLAAAVAFTGYQAVTNNTTNSVSPASSGVAFSELSEVHAVGVPQVRPGTNAANPAAAASIGSTEAHTIGVPQSRPGTNAPNPAAAAGIGAVEVLTSTGAVDTSALARWAQENGHTGSSPTSIGATAGAAATNSYTIPQSAEEAIGQLAQLYTGLARLGTGIPDTTAQATQSGGFTTHAEFVAANVEPSTATSAVAPDRQIAQLEALRSPDTNAGPTQSGGFTTHAEFVAANVEPSTATSAVAPDRQIAQLEALRWGNTSPAAATSVEFDPYPEAPPVPDMQPRSNFASDIEWIEANGFG